MKKYLTFCKEPLVEEVNLDKIGILIRKMSQEEKNQILYAFDTLVFSKQAKIRINRYISEYGYNDENKTNEKIRYTYLCSKHYENLNEDQKLINILYFTEVTKKNINFNRNSVKKLLERTVIFEIDETVIDKYIDLSHVGDFICNFIKFSEYGCGIKSNTNRIFVFRDYDELINDKGMLGITFIDSSTKFDSLISLYYNKNLLIECIRKNTFDFLSDGSTICIFKCIKKFIDNLSTDEIYNLFMIIDNVFHKSNSIENEIVNYVSVIERILMNEDDEKVNRFILKMGIIAQEMLETTDEELLKKQLKFCYEIRSCIVHGNELKLRGYIGQIASITSDRSLVTIDNNANVRNKRKQLLEAILSLLRAFTKLLIIYWIKDFKRIKFIKEN